MCPWRRAPGPGETPPSTAKRRHPRYLLSTRLTAMPESEDEQTRVQSRALDISESGVGGLFHESWNVGIRVKLEVSLPVDEALLRVGAIVRHHTGVRYGFEFMDMSHEQRRTVRVTCEALSMRKGSAS
jgi:c-di-GMP-binding flagellar brake protein YcgR